VLGSYSARGSDPSSSLIKAGGVECICIRQSYLISHDADCLQHQNGLYPSQLALRQVLDQRLGRRACAFLSREVYSYVQ
jgi:hypothetical protein